MFSAFPAEIAMMEQQMLEHGMARLVLDVQPISAKLIAGPEAMLLNASTHIACGDVKLGPVAMAQSREMPIFGALALKAGETVIADTLRVACLLAVSQLSAPPEDDPAGASMRWG